MAQPLKIQSILDQLETQRKTILSLKDQIITNAIIIGQIPSINLSLKDDEVDSSINNLRTKVMIERFAELGIQGVSTDSAGNPIAVIKGNGSNEKCVVIAAHMDTVYHFDQEIHLAVSQDSIAGPGILDNSISLGVLLTIPEILEALNINLGFDVILLGLTESLGESNLRGIRKFLSTWERPILAGIVLEGAELGRLNYYSRSMIRAEIDCNIDMISGWENKYGTNAILIINEVINKILEIHLPQRPHSQVIIGKIKGGVKHGDLALNARLGLEIESTSEQQVQVINEEIETIVDTISHENLVDLTYKEISHVNANRIDYNHPLVKSSIEIMEALNIKPIIESSESELSIFLKQDIPAITIGITHGENYHTEEASAQITPMFDGICQLIGILQALDKGIIDETKISNG
jgi:tripeptide aminopeptidase